MRGPGGAEKRGAGRMLERLKRRLELVGNDRDELLGDLLEEAEQ